jgi:cystathionine gamma-lyase/cystathionine beta-lyase/cystathionine gamma-lyase/homocysteine desulfhydrase
MESGKTAFVFASGMAAINAIATILKAGDHVIVSDNVYGARPALRQGSVALSAVLHLRGYGRSRRHRASFTPATRLLFAETPSNPISGSRTLRGCRSGAPASRPAGRGQHVRESYIQRPIELGADPVTHSTTKYLNGHSDSVGGIVVATRDDDIEWLSLCRMPPARSSDPWIRGWSCAVPRSSVAWRSTTPMVCAR